MDTIGRAFRDSPRAAMSVAAGTVCLDFTLVSAGVYGEVRACVALTALALTVWLTNGDLSSSGLCFRPRQGWSWWLQASIVIGLIVGVLVVAGLGILHVTGHSIEVPVTEPRHGFSRLIHMCVVAPLVEETIYRFVACGLIAGICGSRYTILINGVLFGALHVLYGNPSPENLFGGFFLAWAFLKSESIMIPLLLHSVGNFIVLTFQLISWYILYFPA